MNFGIFQNKGTVHIQRGVRKRGSTVFVAFSLRPRPQVSFFGLQTHFFSFFKTFSVHTLRFRIAFITAVIASDVSVFENFCFRCANAAIRRRKVVFSTPI